MILWPRAKRSITPAAAAEVGQAARSSGAEPVAVFVDEDAATIERCAAWLTTADIRQLSARVLLACLLWACVATSSGHAAFVLDGTFCARLYLVPASAAVRPLPGGCQAAARPTTPTTHPQPT